MKLFEAILGLRFWPKIDIIVDTIASLYCCNIMILNLFFLCVTYIQRNCVCGKGTNCIQYNLLTTEKEQNSTRYNLTITEKEQNIVRISAITVFCCCIFLITFVSNITNFKDISLIIPYIFFHYLGVWRFLLGLFACATCIYHTNSNHTCKLTLYEN